ncbi:SpoVR family protein [Chondrinema litorale]|uniref:SpoVR family protein n=1 Tax=Chondrinema litorale TaxID=2994555 RepID=UPI0025433488|nr:SpoVR family protein [Chondrinema litorale]UZR93394.1 SpoVR family protein [Chondrinema litorale]
MSKIESYKKLFCAKNWNYDTLAAADEVTSQIGRDKFNLTIYPNQIEIVTAEQMIDAYSLIGLPTSYPHWKFGKDFVFNQNNYSKGRQGLSYEMVINSNPCISYNMENNTTCMMVLVIAHACQGHNAFFKNNYMFKDWTSADSIIDYMVFARKFVLKCEEDHSPEEVEAVLDACHALMNHGIDKYHKPPKLSPIEEQERLKRLTNIKRENYNELWKTLPIDLVMPSQKRRKSDHNFPDEPEENLLYFIEKNAPTLPTWKRELVRIVRKVAQYFYPQGMTKVMNEGFATFMHYHIINEMYEQGYLNDGFMLEFLHSHSSVIFQPEYNSKFFSGLNPYTLGFNIFMDIKRICQDPTSEDKEWFPNLIGKNWLDEVHYAMENFRDDSFVLQYLSPKVIRDMRLFTIADFENEDEYEIEAIHNEKGYRRIREYLSEQYKRAQFVPDIQVVKVDRYSNRKLHLLHQITNDKRLNPKDAESTLDYVRYLWEFPVELISRNKLGINEEVYQSE